MIANSSRSTERVLLVGVYKKTSRQAEDYGLEELRRLTETAGGTAVGVFTQRLERFHPASLIGSGKISEIAWATQRHHVRTVIFNHELTPAQQDHLEKTLQAKVVDRTRLILDIFAKRARTKEGELQVELAQLSYMLPRLTGSWRGYSQQVGGIGTRGPGERQLEYERRHIQRRIAALKQGIERLKRERAVQRERRLNIPMPAVAIIGYTNVGKSSLLNRLTGTRAVYADDKLFATLDPTTRRVRLPQGGWAVFTDTVGFISELPTTLIAAFRSTLEEVARADCLLHLEDSDSAYLESQHATVLQVLKELDADKIPAVSAFNKVDLLDAKERRALLAADPERLLISVRTGEGLEQLMGTIQTVLNRRWVLREISLNASQAHCLKEIYLCAQVLEQRTVGDRISLRIRVTPENWKRLLHQFKGNKIC